MTNLEKFIEANPTDPRVVRVLKLMNKPLSMNGALGKALGELMRVAG